MTTTPTAHSHSFSLLLAQYIAGRVESDQLDALCELVEDTDATAAERLAFARYYLDTMTEEAPALPQATEWSEIINSARA